MVTHLISNDGFVRRDYNTANKDPTSLGDYFTKSGTSSGTPAESNSIIVGYWGSPVKRYDAAFTFSNLQINKGDTVKTAKLRLYFTRCYASWMLNVYIAKSPKSAVPDPVNEITLYELGNSVKFFNGNNDPNKVSYFYWNYSQPYIEIDVASHLRELVSQSNYAIGDRAVFFVKPAKFNADVNDSAQAQNDGFVGFRSIESGSNYAQLIYEIEAPALNPVITSVSIDNEIKAGETNIVIAGENLGNTTLVKLVSGTKSYQQYLTYKQDSELRFNIGSVPSNSAYILTITTSTGATATKAVTVRDEIGQQVPVPPDIPEEPTTPEVPAENVTSGTVYVSKDGHEYATTTSYADGVWENSASVTSATQYLSEYDRLFVGAWNGYVFKAHMKMGPFNIAKDSTIASARLDLKIDVNYKINNFLVKAVANPLATDLGVGNDITAQTLTTANVGNSNSAWEGYQGTDFWKQTPSPYPLNVTSIVQEMVNHPNWVSGSYINFVIDYFPDPSRQGHTRFYSNDKSANKASSLTFVVNNGTEIKSVSNDNILELGEVNATIIGFNLTGATNLRITKGAVNVSQTIKSVTDTNVVFNLTNGAITADTGYTLSLDVDGKTYSKTIEVTQGGGVNNGTVGGAADGHETNGVFYEEYQPTGQVWIGKPPLGNNNEYIATLRVGPINAQRNQNITLGRIRWNTVVGRANAYKEFPFDIAAVKDPTIPELGTGNLISSQVLTDSVVHWNSLIFTTSNSSDYWETYRESITVTPVIQEMVNHPKWETGSYIQLVFTPAGYPSGNAYISFGSIESGATPDFIYTTGASTSIANVNGTNIIKFGDVGIVVTGNDLSDIVRLYIRYNGIELDQQIDNLSDDNFSFDFFQGDMSYGPAKLVIVDINDEEYIFNIELRPRDDYNYVILTSASLGNGSLTFNDLPPLVKGDVIEYQKTSANGFGVEIKQDGTPTIKGGNGTDSFLVRGYQSIEQNWYELQQVIFYDSGYLNANVIPLLEFSQTVGLISITTEPEEPVEPTDPVDPAPVVKPVITSVNSGNELISGQQNIIIRGTNLIDVYILRLIGISEVYYQTMTSIKSSEIRFNLGDSVPDNAYYALEAVNKSGQKATVQVKVSKSSVVDPVDPVDPTDPVDPVDPDPPIPPIIVDPSPLEVWVIQNDEDDDEVWQ